jgi:hypothetical protein
VIVRGQRSFALRLQLANSRFERTLVDADYVVMLVLNTERLGECYDQMLLVQLRIALDGWMIGAFRNLAQVSEGLVFEFFECVRH